MKYNVPLEIKENEAVSELLQFVRPNSVVLEFGCANGRMTKYMKEQLHCKVYIVEYEAEAYADAKEFAEDGICGDIMEFKWLTQFAGIQFDYIIFADVLEHLYDPDRVLLETNKLLKEDGRILVSLPNVGHNDILIKLFQGKFEYTKIGLLDNTHIHLFAEDSIDAFCRAAGYAVVRKQYTRCKTGESEQFVDAVPDINPVLRSIIDERVNGMIYQFILVLQKEEYVAINNIVCEKAEDIRSSISGKIYYNWGNGYSEADAYETEIVQNADGTFCYESDWDISDGLFSVRFDPTEGKCCLIKSAKAHVNAQEVPIRFINYLSNGEHTVLMGPDPQLEIDCSQYTSGSMHVKVLFAVEGTRAYSETQNVLSHVHNEINELLKAKDELMSDNTEMIKQIRELSFLSGQLDNAVTVKTMENEEVKLENAAVKQENEAIKQENAEIKQGNEAIKQENSEIKQKNKAVEKENVEMRLQIEVYENQVHSINNENAYCREEISRLNAELAHLRTLYDDVCRQSTDNYNRLVERSNAAEFWEGYAEVMRNSRSWKLTRPLRAPGRLKQKLAADKQRKSIQKNGSVKFSIVMPVYNVEIRWLQEAIDSVKNQTYVNWELCIADDASTHEEVIEFLKKIRDKRIKIAYQKENGGISVASNAAARLATGEYILLMDNDDVLAPNAIEEFYECVMKTQADVIYSDQDIIDMDGNHSCPVYKPNWSPDLFRSQMYLGHLTGFKKALFDEVGGFRKEFDGSQDYDLLLRIVEKTNKIEHIDKILYSWRTLPSSTAANPDSKPYAQYAGLNAVQAHLDRTLGENKAKALETENLFVYDVKYTLSPDTKISIIIPTKDHADDLDVAITSIFEKSTWRNFEIIVLNNNSEEEDTYEYFRNVVKKYSNVKVVDAFYEFNWSKLNNHGIEQADGDVYLFLNNDVKVLTADWLERLASEALRPEVGTVGALLLYEDGTIQHGGVIVGFGGWADHAYKGARPIHNGTPYISPVVTRNVSAVTGACMAISRKTIEKIGLFDDEFIICGSDVEICIRASQMELYNIYDPHVRLMHYESKSRGTFVPQIDFELSYKMYTPYRENGDPFYNNNLDYSCFVPTVKGEQTPIVNTERFMDVSIPEITPIEFRKVEIEKPRLNILLPSLNPEHVFGGIATAYKFFQEVQKATGMNCRVLLVDAMPNKATIDKYGEEYVFLEAEDDTVAEKIIVPLADRNGKTLPVSDKDYFIFTGWWTAYCIQEAYTKWKDKGLVPNTFMYLIQDYEPGFYQWSSHYLLADSTYRTEFEQIAIFNSSELKEYFDFLGYKFGQHYVFEPVLNAGLKKYLLSMKTDVKKKKQILVYGRPNTARNAFVLLVQALRKWVAEQENVEEWKILSAGENHDKVDLGRGMMLEPVGKLTIEEYAKTLEETYAGVSLMVSPHPSYPPLEMSVFGVRVITNTYANKDLSTFNNNITSLNDACPISIAKALHAICDEYATDKKIELEQNEDYCYEGDSFGFVDDLAKTLLLNCSEK